LSVLVVEDDSATAQLLASVVEEVGVRATTVAEPAEALEAVRARRPSLVLLDYRLRESDGLDLLRDLRADASLKPVPIVGVTASRVGDERVAAFALACDDFVIKPFDLEELMALVEGYLVAAALGSQPLPLTDPVVPRALDHIHPAAVAIDDDFRVLAWNRAAEQQYGVSAAEAVGAPLQTAYRFMWPEPGTETLALAELEARGSWRGQNVHVRRDGSLLRVESSVVRLRGEPTGMLALIRPLGAG
jgi:PAS domain S-box-containing protein